MIFKVTFKKTLFKYTDLIKLSYSLIQYSYMVHVVLLICTLYCKHWFVKLNQRDLNQFTTYVQSTDVVIEVEQQYVTHIIGNIPLVKLAFLLDVSMVKIS